MPKFRTVDLSKYFNHPGIVTDKRGRGNPSWDASACDAWADMPRGRGSFQGIPFRLASEDPSQNSIIALGRGMRDARVPLRGRANYICIMHFCDAVPRPRKEAALGDLLAEYTLGFSDGTHHTKPIRKRFEVDCFGAGRERGSFAALPHLSATVPAPEDRMPYGRRETGVKFEFSPRFLADIYAMENPKPDVPLSAISFHWKGAISIGILGLTLYSGAGHPLRLERRNIFKVTLPRSEKAEIQGVRAEVDLGHITRVAPAPDRPGKSWAEDVRAGLGEKVVSKPTSRFLVEAATARGATLRIQTGKNKRHEFMLDGVYSSGTARSSDGAARVRILHPQRTWVRVRVVDASTGEPTPTRIHFSGPNGEYLPPHGHHSDVNTNWFEDYAGEVKLGGTNYAYVPGEFQIEPPVGDVYVEISKGFEYEPTRTKIAISPDQRQLELRIARSINLRKEGWVTADTHVHFISPQTAWLEGQAEGLNLVNLLASQWGRMFTNVADITGEASGCSADDTIVWVGTENRHHMLGHLSMLGVKGEAVFPMCEGGPSEAYFGDPEFCLLAEWAERCRKQQGVTIRPHFPGPTCEDPTYFVLGLLDAAEMRSCGHPTKGPLSSASLAEWYRYLNCGYRVAVAGGTDKMSAGTPVGGSRTYARLFPDEPFSFESWKRAVRAGRTFVSNGPLIGLTVEGREIGDEIRLPNGGGTLQIEATAQSVWPIHTLEIIVNGRVVDSTYTGRGERNLTLRSSLSLRESAWIAARCVSELEKYQAMMGAGHLGAHTSPVYVIVGGRDLFSPSDAVYMLTLLEGTVAYLDALGTRLSERRHQEMVSLVHKAENILRSRLEASASSSQGH